ncbi:PIG-L family deacetylase [Streptomyces sp. H27-C3]|uniref:PIG-L deacetylase family protein n=1 Tax=Streptomyces sp. H27-C3 TaxID=3046305 RepID=UPI0024BBE7B1|nr:PIG-L family deacetylase [Streptomyces sp. H27-C3]MDJ0462513.1 PIG-L family deacetylase [Streptomyces sp. H27-C3]
MNAADGSGTHVVVSPHPDDAVWSLGGRLARWASRGTPVTVVTVFDAPAAAGAERLGDAADAGDSGTADGLDGPARWRSIAEPAVRRREDRAALDALGAAHVSLGFTDAALRTSDGRYRYSSAPRVRGHHHPDDAVLSGAIRDALRPWCPPGARVHGPLAAGRHVDHVLVREAVERLGRPDTAWYEDFPYPLRRRDHDGMTADCEPLTAADLDSWLAGAALYASQARALFGGTDVLRETLLARVRAHGATAELPYADRYWLRSARVAADAGPGGPPPHRMTETRARPVGRP